MMTVQPNSQSIANAKPAPLHVVIIGGGIGGLTLAQGLKKSGVSVAVYERDRTRTDRVQGYRVHINPAGSRALHECLPPHLFEAFTRTCGKPSGGIRFVTERMSLLLALGFDDSKWLNGDGVASHRSVSRITLRQMLLSGIEDVVHFGKTFVRYEEAATGRIVAHFEDGTTAEGDVLVAADGGGSRVRRQYLPHAQRVDTGMVGIAGKVFLDAQGRRQVPPEFLGTLTLVAGIGGYSFFAAPQEIDGAAAGEFGGNDESAKAGGHFDNTRSYLMWAFGARREKFGLAGDAEQISGEPLRDVVLREMAARSWDDRFQRLVRLSDADTINAIAIRTSVPTAAWPAHRVTLLGDAIHAMTPYQGIGANIALKDAANLARALAAVDRGERPLLEAVGGYEAAMVDYGFRAVRRSLHAMHRSISDNPLKLTVSRIVLRLIGRVAPLKRRMTQAAGNE
jgi:2-polyprenyl-6-methoxyphenol hydroxylase-like FAD-dependent oxidoreductase